MLDHLDDIASDMSVFHRVDDIDVLDGPTFFKRAWRLPAYAGVMQARALAEREDEAPTRSPGAYSAPSGLQRSDVNPGTRTTLMADPEFQGIFSFG